ncbi:response regulator [Permianibacter sp. IMCC34836]|uniref:hybrid sensor histidine kinase/response regulator n=1 Tax=Permianibacter fluminis TaxID=2738515 RepID=UPI00155221C5|nr:Hpt domain-containing protein [Permianibacter fluminis]NQD35799.1 response regulator [Permianibacter fluminis]
MADNYDQLALKWVREEVNKTLDQARQALEAFAENADDSTQIRFCSSALHQVRGTLQMLEFYGAALFAEEMEYLAEAIAEGKVKNPPRAQEVLMGTILQLPTYLERVQAGQRDLPVVLLPLLNDLRASRGETLLSESAIFTPTLLGVKTPLRQPLPDQPQNSDDYKEFAKKLRHHYQRGLLGVLRNQDVKESLQRLVKVVERLECGCTNTPIATLWWVAGGFIESIAENDVYKNASVHALLGQIDKYLKQLGEEGSFVLQHEPPAELLKNLLYYVACAQRETDRIKELQSAYDLRSALPTASDLETERQRMTGSDAGAIRTVLQALNEDLAGVKDGLDLFVRSKTRSPQDLLNLLPTLRQIADTLGMLGLGVPRDSVRQQVNALQKLADSGQAPTDAHVMDIAGALLFVEANLTSVAANAAAMAAEDADSHAPAAGNDEEIAAEAQFDAARDVLINECRGNLQKCKDSIIDFMASSWDHRLLEGVPTLLVEVQGGLGIIGLPDAAQMIGSCQQFLATRVLGAQGVPNAGVLDALADVLTSVEYFLESLQEAGGQGLESVLAAAREATGIIDAELARAPTPAASAAAPSPVAPAPAPVSAPAPAPTPAPSFAATDSDMIDQEVIEIFIEEAGEQLATINELLPRWAENEDDKDSLITIRRAFHTLKGSGRLVGAKLLGEMAWSIENMLNRVLDNTVPVTRELLAVVREASQVVIPALREAFTLQSEPTIRPEALMARADALSRGESMTAAPAPAPTPVTAPAPVAPSEPSHDETIAELPVAQVEEPIVAEPVATVEPVAEASGFSVEPEYSFDGAEELVAELPVAELPAIETGSEPAATEDSSFGELVETIEFSDDALPVLSLEEPALEEPGAAELTDLAAGEFEPMAELAGEASAGLPTASVEEEPDNTLYDIFAGEAGGHLDAIDSYLADMALSPFSPKVSDELIRALHTLKGSARMAQLDSIAAVISPLEKQARELQNRDANVPSDYLALLADGKTALAQALPALQAGQLPDAVPLLALAARIEALELQEPSATANANERDPELLSLFLSEAMDLVSDADMALNGWQQQADSGQAGHTLVELMSALKQASETSRLPLVAQLAQALAGLYQRAAIADSRDAAFFQLAHRGQGALFDQLDRIAADQSVQVPSDLLAALDAWTGTSPAAVEVAAGFTLRELPREETPAPVANEPEEISFDAVAEPMLDAPAFDVPAAVVEPISEAVAESPVHDEPVYQTPTADVVSEGRFEDNSFTGARAADLFTPGLALPAYDETDAPQAITIDEDGEEILQIFLEEADEILDSIDETLAAWLTNPDDIGSVAILQRHLHTLKGGARLSDLKEIGDLSHELENLFEAITDGRMQSSPVFIRVAQEARDRLADLVTEVRNDRTQTHPSAYWRRLQIAIAGQDPYAGVQAPVSAPTRVPASTPAGAPTTPAVPVVSTPQQPAVGAPVSEPGRVVPFPAKEKQPVEPARPAAQQGEFVRVQANALESLVNLAGETSIFRGRLEQQFVVLRQNLHEMEQTVARLREQLRVMEIENEAQIQHRKEAVGQEYEEFDPLEFDRYTRQQEQTRLLSESAGDLLNLKEALDNLASDSETLLLQQGRVNSELQDGLMRTRMVPFSSVVPRLKRMVRQIGEELGKGVEIAIHADGEMDRTVLERMVAPLEHMIRNAIDHGIERPEKRVANGKPATGRIKIRLLREGGEVVVEIADDGAGINLGAVKRKAIERGLITEQSQLTDHELMLLILEAGFSTAEQVTQISGRGVGMDVVASEIKELGGRIDIDSETGKGSRFTVRLPFTVSVNQALMVQVGDDIYSIPLANIEGIVRVSPYELQTYYGDESVRYEYAGQPYRMRYLGTLIDHNRTPRFEGVFKPLPVLLLHGSEHPIALQVDELLGSREIVVKSVGSLLSTISGLSGATILGDGRVVLILDLPALLRRADAIQAADEVVEVVDDTLPLALVVDDSITVRKVTARLLERHNYRVLTAKDGVDAVNVLHDHKPDIMLLDVEMPRMDGFELAGIVRHDDRLKDVPIIMITSRTGDKHRARAEEIGVNRYLGKPFNEVELLNTMSQLLDARS